jgi:peptide/nickel transport system permease protein
MERLHSQGAETFTTARYVLDYLWHAALPVTCLSLFSLASLAMYGRSSMLDVLCQDYMRTAKAKGVSRFQIVAKHGLRNGMIPIITLFASFLPALLGGSVLIEFVFNINGLGLMGFRALLDKDVPTLMALIYVDAIVVMISMLLTDILYVLVDPRITFGSQGKTS